MKIVSKAIKGGVTESPNTSRTATKTMPPKNTPLKKRPPMSVARQKCGAYTRVICNCLVVNSSKRWKSYSSIDAVRQRGTNLIGRLASRRTLIIVKSSDTVPCHRSRIRSVSKVERLIAVEPPQQKFLSECSPSADAIEAFQTDKS